MKEFKKILFPVDLSETSEIIVPYVKTMAQKFDAEIHLLFVSRVFEYFTAIYVPHPSVNRFESEVVEGATKKLEEFKEEYFADLPKTKMTVTPGDAAEDILKYIKSEGMDLVIMATHGRKGLDKIIFGSVAEQVVKTANVPVLIVNPYTAI
ncbi:Universal stress protein [Candidatus Magnetomoraceae bacterium gMMP-15]